MDLKEQIRFIRNHKYWKELPSTVRNYIKDVIKNKVTNDENKNINICKVLINHKKQNSIVGEHYMQENAQYYHHSSGSDGHGGKYARTCRY